MDAWGAASKALVIVILLLIAGYIAIDFAAPLPRFLQYENIVLALLYTCALILHLKRSPKAYIYTVTLASFNAGRVSRSIVKPTGELGPLALQHVPLFLLVFTAALLAAFLEARTEK